MDLSRTLVDTDRGFRAQLLEGTTITLDVYYYIGPTAHHPQQLLAAQSLVCHDRYRQLCDQAEGASHASSSVRVEFPEHALRAVSWLFADKQYENGNIYKCEVGPNTYCASIDLGRMLPGYLMEILDWYCGALRAKSWKDFLPVDPSLQDCDKFYWLYIYITMRRIGMDGFADSLGPFVAILVDQHQLVDGVWMLEFILEELSDDDTLLRVIAERYAKLENAGQSPLFREQWALIFKQYTHFGNHLKSYVNSNQDLSDQFSNMISLAETQLARLGIEDCDIDDTER
jgi:hypothetical protein